MIAFQVIEKEPLNNMVIRMVLYAPLIAMHAEPGQFVIVHCCQNSERIPLTIADYDRKQGTITLIYQIVGAATMELNKFCVGDALRDVVGPLGKATETENLNDVCLIGGGVGCAIAYPIAKKLHTLQKHVVGIVGFRSQDLIILKKEFQTVCNDFYLMTDDGSEGTGGFVTQALEQLLDSGKKFDEVIAIGPLPMMKAVCQLTRVYGVKTVVSMNPIMIDGTGMCGCCRLKVGGIMKFACIDGPDFDGHQVDFDEVMMRSRQYKQQEGLAREKMCNLLRMGESR